MKSNLYLVAAIAVTAVGCADVGRAEREANPGCSGVCTSGELPICTETVAWDNNPSNVEFYRAPIELLGCLTVDVTEPTAFVFQNERSFTDFWREHYRCSPSDPPPFDFSTGSLAFFLYGPDDCARSGCTSRTDFIQAIEDRGSEISVQYRELEAFEFGNCFACIQPWDAAVFPSCSDSLAYPEPTAAQIATAPLSVGLWDGNDPVLVELDVSVVRDMMPGRDHKLSVRATIRTSDGEPLADWIRPEFATVISSDERWTTRLSQSTAASPAENAGIAGGGPTWACNSLVDVAVQITYRDPALVVLKVEALEILCPE